jgi:hypothetical protein
MGKAAETPKAKAADVIHFMLMKHLSFVGYSCAPNTELDIVANRKLALPLTEFARFAQVALEKQV